MKLHFLHIGKTGGTALKYVLSNSNLKQQSNIQLHNHKTRLVDIPLGESVIFFIRDPISRFISGFYSRKRKGQPRYNSQWDEFETELFSIFSTPNELVSALVNTNSPNHIMAKQAMQKVKHLRSMCFWLTDVNYIKSRMKDIKYIGFQEELDDHFNTLKGLLMLPSDIYLPKDPINSHRNPVNLDLSLSEENTQYLKVFFAKDYKILDFCKGISFS